MDQPDVMVYLMTGFLDSGKTQFLKFTLEQDYFQIPGTTLLILCEEGEEEYGAAGLKKFNIVVERVESQEELTEEFLKALDEKHHPERVVVEYNGMWKVSDFEKLKLPDGWGIEQKLTTVDASTFQMYLTNLKPLFVEMVRGSELVLFNRCNDIKPLAGYRRSVKVVSPQAEVIFEDEQGEVENIFENDQIRVRHDHSMNNVCDALREHLKILQCLEERDADGAAEAMVEHLRLGRMRAMDTIF